MDRRPDRSTFVIGLPIFFLFFLWMLLFLDPVGFIPSVDPAAPASPPRYEGRIAEGSDVAHGGIDLHKHVADGLLWLARHQFEDGSWSAYYFHQNCVDYCGGLGDPEHDVGVTALSALAFLNSGMTGERVGSVDFGEVTRRALSWLAARQDRDGCFRIGPRSGKFLYGHAIATTAFARAYAVFGDPGYPKYFREGIRFLEAARNPGKAWRYGIRDGSNDTSVTGWASLAMVEARKAGIEVPETAFLGVREWLDEVTDDRYFDVSYMRRRGGPAWIRGVNESFQRTESLTAVGMVLRLEMGESADSLPVREGRKRLRRDLPTWEGTDGRCVNYCYWYYGVRALSLLRKENDVVWRHWSERVTSVLANHQRRYTEPCVWGSWDPVDKWGAEGGRVYATALNVLTLGMLLPE